MTRKLGVAIAGAGPIAAEEHLPSWLRRSDAEVRALVELDTGRLNEVADAFGVSGRTTDLGEAVSRSDIDVVDICLPAEMHTAAAQLALAGGKHVLLEKPVTVNIAEAQSLADAASAAGRVLMVAENWVFASSSRFAKEKVETGALGEILSVKLAHEADTCVRPDPPNWVREPGRTRRGYVLNGAIHSISLLRFLAGEVDQLAAYAHVASTPQYPTTTLDTDVVIAGRLRSGALLSANFTGTSRRHGQRQLRCSVFGTLGVVEFDVLTGDMTFDLDGQRQTILSGPASMGFDEELEHFVAAIRGGHPPLTSIVDQIETMRTVEAIYDSLIHDGAPILMPPAAVR